MPFHQKLKNISHLSALRNDDVDLGLVVGADRNIFNLPHDEQTVDNATKDDVFPQQQLKFSVTKCWIKKLPIKKPPE